MDEIDSVSDEEGKDKHEDAEQAKDKEIDVSDEQEESDDNEGHSDDDVKENDDDDVKILAVAPMPRSKQAPTTQPLKSPDLSHVRSRHWHTCQCIIPLTVHHYLHSAILQNAEAQANKGPQPNQPEFAILARIPTTRTYHIVHLAMARLQLRLTIAIIVMKQKTELQHWGKKHHEHRRTRTSTRTSKTGTQRRSVLYSQYWQMLQI